MKLLQSLERLTDHLDPIIELVAIGTGFVSIGLAFLDAVARYGFNHSYEWASELSTYTMIYGIFMFAGVVWKREGHVRMDVILGKLSGKSRGVHALVTDLVCLFACVYLLLTGIDLAKISITRDLHTTSGILPIWTGTLAIPIGMAVFTFYSLVKAAKSLLFLFAGTETERRIIHGEG